MAASDTSAAAATTKPRLNVPAAMAGSLRLDSATSPVSSSTRSSASRLFDLPKTPSPSKVTYSDRFIPCRSSSRLQNFALTSPNKNSPAAAPDTPYTRLLRAELFPDSSPTGNPTGSPNTNLFRFKTDHSAPTSPFATSDKQVGSGTSTPKKAPRKVPKTPHKVPGPVLSRSHCRKHLVVIARCIELDHRAGAGRAVSAGRLLPESCGLVLAEHARRRPRHLRLPLVRLQ